MDVDLNELKERISKKSDLELGKMLSVEREDYTKETIEIAEQELKKRNIEKTEIQKERALSIEVALGIINDQRIIEELKKACEQIGFIDVEEAFWILIPKNPEEKTVWLEAVGGGKDDKILSSFRLPSMVMYRPSEEEKRKLITFSQEALWVLHIHNHPHLSEGEIGSCGPSKNDICFAADWRSINPDLTNKMKFFVIQGNEVVEYSGVKGLERKIDFTICP